MSCRPSRQIFTDIEDVKAVAPAIIRHRIVRNYKAEADGMHVDRIIGELMA
jgi:MoxR-like ATPase